MLNIVIIRGGLGNQMFAYAYYLALKERFKFSLFELDPVDCYTAHNGYELPNIFQKVNKKKSYKYYRRIQKLHSEYFTRYCFKEVNEKIPGYYYNDFVKSNYPFVVHKGFWQTENYFKCILSRINNIYQFDLLKLNEPSIAQLKILENENSISIHIRGGDYLDNFELNGICNIDYYNRAVDFFLSRVENPKFYVFTNDIVHYKSKINLSNFKLIDWNTGKDNWQDMCLMSYCKHNIIANSTFGWWGAYLNKNLTKIVVGPAMWYNFRKTNDILPSNWIKV